MRAGHLRFINLDVTAGLFFLNGGFAPSLLPHPGTVSLGFPMPAGLTISAQQVVAPTGHPDGFDLSQAAEVTGVSATAFPGPAGDDIAMTFTAGAPLPGCNGPTPSISMYGTTYTNYALITNGRWTMGAANTSFTAANPGDTTFAGLWCDLNTATAGTITVEVIAGGMRANYNGVGFFGGTAAATNTFKVDVTTVGDVLIHNGGAALSLATIAGNQYVGICPAAGAAIAAGVPAAPWGLGTTYTSATPLDAIGAFGAIGSTVAPGTNAMAFTWSAGGYILNVF